MVASLLGFSESLILWIQNMMSSRHYGLVLILTWLCYPNTYKCFNKGLVLILMWLCYPNTYECFNNFSFVWHDILPFITFQDLVVVFQSSLLNSFACWKTWSTLNAFFFLCLGDSEHFTWRLEVIEYLINDEKINWNNIEVWLKLSIAILQQHQFINYYY